MGRYFEPRSQRGDSSGQRNRSHSGNERRNLDDMRDSVLAD